MARPRATEEQRDAQRQRIRAAAREIYDEAGNDRVSIRAVAARAGVSQGLIYSYFDSRNELLRSLWLEPVIAAGIQLEEVAASIEDPRARIRALLTGYIDFAIAQPEVHRGAMLFVRPASSPKPSQAPAGELAFYRLMLEAIEELAQASELPVDDPVHTVELLWAAVHGALSLAINTDIYRISGAESLAPRMVDLLMDRVI